MRKRQTKIGPMRPLGQRLCRDDRRMVLAFLLPAAILYCALFLYPALKAFYISLFDWSGFSEDMTFVGMGNYLELLGDDSFWNVAFKNTVILMLLGGLIAFSIAFLLSAVLSDDLKGRKLFRGIIFFPAVMSPVAIAILWSFLYNSQWGLLNSLLQFFGLSSLIRIWTAPGNLFWALLAVFVWMYTGYYCIILLAALDQVPKDYIEAAQIDGANPWTIFFRIKLPAIKDVLATAITLWCINAVKEFALFFSWGGGIDLPSNDATNLAVKMYVTAFGRRVSIFRMGYATVMGIVMFLLVVLMIVLVTQLFKSRSLED